MPDTFSRYIFSTYRRHSTFTEGSEIIRGLLLWIIKGEKVRKVFDGFYNFTWAHKIQSYVLQTFLFWIHLLKQSANNFWCLYRLLFVYSTGGCAIASGHCGRLPSPTGVGVQIPNEDNFLMQAELISALRSVSGNPQMELFPTLVVWSSYQGHFYDLAFLRSWANSFVVQVELASVQGANVPKHPLRSKR